MNAACCNKGLKGCFVFVVHCCHRFWSSDQLFSIAVVMDLRTVTLCTNLIAAALIVWRSVSSAVLEARSEYGLDGSIPALS